MLLLVEDSWMPNFSVGLLLGRCLPSTLDVEPFVCIVMRFYISFKIRHLQIQTAQACVEGLGMRVSPGCTARVFGEGLPESVFFVALGPACDEAVRSM